MKKCPKCLADQTNVNSSACYYCGTDMSEVIESESNSNSNDYCSDKDEYIPEQNISLPDTDELGIETNADLMESEAKELKDTAPIYENHQNNDIMNEKKDKSSFSAHESQKIKKLSENEIKEIEKNLYKSDDYFNNKEKNDLIQKINSVNSSSEKPFNNQPIEPHKKDTKQFDTPVIIPTLNNDLPLPQTAKKGQGLAYFFHNYIEIQGSQKLHPEDMLIINNREYVLKPKNFNNKIALYSVAALVLLIVSVVGSFLVGNSNFGNGQVLGVIVDENNNPYIEGATIIFSELGEKSKSDAQGLFSFSNIPAGSHKIEYQINNKVVGSDYITIADNKNSFITLKPSKIAISTKPDPLKQLELASAAQKIVNTPKPQVETPKKESVQTAKVTTPVKKNQNEKTNKKDTPPKASSVQYGKLTLNANVDGAKIKVDGNVLGAGNLTYSKIKSGTHTYSITLDGYESVSGNFTIVNDETIKLSPTLKALTQAKKEESFKKSDYYYSALNAYKQGDYATAIADYQKVIDKSPNAVDAYFGIAEAYSKIKKWDLAYDSFIRAAEIHQFKGRTNDAITCYNSAIKVNNKEVTAFLGRGRTYLNIGEFRAALGDYDKVVKLDKRNFDGYYGMGETSFKLQKYSQAIEYFKDARSINSENSLVHQYLTLAYMFEHDRKNTQKSFENFNQYASENEKNNFKNDSQYATLTKYIDSE